VPRVATSGCHVMNCAALFGGRCMGNNGVLDVIPCMIGFATLLDGVLNYYRYCTGKKNKQL
jgi:hypothetical protein